MVTNFKNTSIEEEERIDRMADSEDVMRPSDYEEYMEKCALDDLARKFIDLSNGDIDNPEFTEVDEIMQYRAWKYDLEWTGPNPIIHDEERARQQLAWLEPLRPLVADRIAAMKGINIRAA